MELLKLFFKISLVIHVFSCAFHFLDSYVKNNKMISLLYKITLSASFAIAAATIIYPILKLLEWSFFFVFLKGSLFVLSFACFLAACLKPSDPTKSIWDNNVMIVLTAALTLSVFYFIVM